MVSRRNPEVRVRTELGGQASNRAGEPLATLLHISDMHVLDAASPARAEWIELEGHDPLWRPLLHMHRPYDALTAIALHAHVRTIAADPVGSATKRPIDLVVSTGDNIDNAQRNELDAYLAIVAGGVAHLSARGSAQDAPPGSTWPYWSPDGSVDDAWRTLGYPVVEGFVERVSAPIRSSGLGVPWTSVPGNHDLLRQGTALPNERIERIAAGSVKSLTRPAGLMPEDPLSTYLDRPEAFSAGSGVQIAPDPARRAIDRAEWIELHARSGAVGWSDDERGGAHVEAHVGAGAVSADTVIDLDHVRLILLDTNHPDGDYQGSLALRQLAWLDERLGEVDRSNASAAHRRVAVLVSHHGADSLVNVVGGDPQRRLAADLTAVVHRHPCVIAWLVGHRHVNRIEPRIGPNGGFWEITTCSTIDWPSQTRTIEIVRHLDGSHELICTMRDHADAPEGLATLHRDLARRFASTGVATRMAGRKGDTDVRLVVPAPPRV